MISTLAYKADGIDKENRHSAKIVFYGPTAAHKCDFMRNPIWFLALEPVHDLFKGLSKRKLVIPQKSSFTGRLRRVNAILCGIPFGFGWCKKEPNGIPHKFSFAASRAEEKILRNDGSHKTTSAYVCPA